MRVVQRLALRWRTGLSRALASWESAASKALVVKLCMTRADSRRIVFAAFNGCRVRWRTASGNACVNQSESRIVLARCRNGCRCAEERHCDSRDLVTS